MQPFFIVGQSEQHPTGKISALGALGISKRLEQTKGNQGPDGDRLEIEQSSGTSTGDASGQPSQVQENLGVEIVRVRSGGRVLVIHR